MNTNAAIQNTGLIAWNGAASFAHDITNHNDYAFSMEIVSNILVDAVFTFESAPPSALNKCLPGTFTPVDAVAICSEVAVGQLATVTIPAGTLAGQSCAVALPCKPDVFVRPVAVSGDTANVRIVMILHGKHR